MDKEIVLEVKNLYYSYNKEYVLKNINFKVYNRDFLGIIGPNGGGKSTLLKILLGLLKIQKGEVKLFGLDPLKGREFIGYLPQNTNINLDFPIRVIDVVTMGNRKKHQRSILFKLLGFKYSQSEIKCAINSLKEVGINEEYLFKKIGELSGGERQRVLIARALCSHPKMLILDEPTSSLDIEGSNKIFELLKKLNKFMTIIVVTHDIANITKYANKIIYINRESFLHDLSDLDFMVPDSEHFCEIEMMKMLSSKGKDV